MSHSDSTQWRAHAQETRIRAEKMKGEISKHLMLRITEDYEQLARTVEHRPKPLCGRGETIRLPEEIRRRTAAGVGLVLNSPVSLSRRHDGRRGRGIV